MNLPKKNNHDWCAFGLHNKNKMMTIDDNGSRVGARAGAQCTAHILHTSFLSNDEIVASLVTFYFSKLFFVTEALCWLIIYKVYTNRKSFNNFL